MPEGAVAIDGFAQGALPHSPEEEVIARVCDPPGTSIAGSFASVAEAHDYAVKVLGVREGVPVSLPPPAPPPPYATLIAPTPFPRIAKEALRLGVVAQDRTTGSMAFLDWAVTARAGDHAVATLVYVVGPGAAGRTLPPQIASVTAAVIKFDCAAKSVQAQLELAWDIYGHFLAQSTDLGPVRPVAAGSVDALALEQACHGRPPARVFSDLNEAVAAAKTSWSKPPNS